MPERRNTYPVPTSTLAVFLYGYLAIVQTCSVGGGSTGLCKKLSRSPIIKSRVLRLKTTLAGESGSVPRESPCPGRFPCALISAKRDPARCEER